MNIKNKKRANRFLTILFTLLFAASVFTVTAFATGADSSQTITPTTDPTTVVSTGGSTSAPDSSKDETGGTGSSTDGTSESGTSKPDGQSSSSEVSSQASSAVRSSSPASSRRETASSKKQSDIPKHVDTQESRVEQIASQADAAVSDPGVLSSENWSELLSSGGQSSAPSSTDSDAGLSSATSSKASQGSGISWLLILGIVLIVLAICGIVFFVYEQFLKGHDDDFGGPSGPSGPSGPNDISSHSSGDSSQTDTSPTEFTDISSDSDGVQHREGYVPAGKQSPVSAPPAANDAPSASPTDSVPAAPAAPEAKVQKTVNLKSREANAGDITAPIPQEKLPPREPSLPESETQSLPKAQATPLENGKNFDWEEFFNGNDK